MRQILLARFVRPQEGPEALAAVESSLEASLVCLMIVTCPGLDRKLCSDELIDCCLGLFRCGAMEKRSRTRARRV